MKRIEQLISLLKKNNMDGMLISSEANISYLTGFTGDSSRLIVSPKGCAFLTDGRYTEQALKEIHSEITIFKWLNDNRYGYETYAMAAREFQIKNLAFEGDVMSYNDYAKLSKQIRGFTFQPLSGLVEELRQIKDADEIEKLRTACAISDKALEATIPYIKEGVTEQQILAQLEYFLKTMGGDDLSFETMVLSGAKTSMLHGKAGQKRIQKGDFILFDFGALYQGYHADISRTFVLGKANDQQKEMYQIIRQAQQASCNAVKAGVHGTEADKAVRQNIPSNYIDYYYPGLGHGIGLEIHEFPFIKNTCDFVFQENMCLTIEPGIYIPDVGGLRIEDSILVSKDGFESLSNFPRDLIEL